MTALALSRLQQDAFDSSDSKDFEARSLKMIKDSPIFHYWDLILKTEVQVLIFIRAEKFSTLYRITDVHFLCTGSL